MNRKSLTELYNRVANERYQEKRNNSSKKEEQREALKGTGFEKEVGKLQPAFERAHDGKVKQNEKSTQSKGSEMIAKEGSRLNMNPPPHMRQGADRQKHNAELNQDHQRTKDMEYAKSIKKARQKQYENDRMKNGREME